MGAVIAFKRPERVPADPPTELWHRIRLDKFDEITRFLVNPDVPYAVRVKFINDWREHWEMERLECAETRHE